jgi:periplasmic protein TonB
LCLLLKNLVEMTRQEERKKRLTAALTTVGVNVLVFLLLIFTAAWKNAGSGPGEYPGIEVNLGYDEQGSGDIQPEEPIGSEQATDDENSPAEPDQETAEEQSSTPVAQEQAESKVVQPNTVTDPNSDVEIKEEKKEEKPAEKVVEKKPVEKPVEKKVEEKPVVDTKAVYQGKKNTNSTTTGTGDGKQGTTGSEGDDKSGVGDKGVEGGTPGANVYKGRPGGGDGGSIEINGWDYDRIPKVVAPDDQTGRVVFEFELDSEGEVTRITKVEGSVSPATERECRNAIGRITFTKSGSKVPTVTRGKIIFTVVAR